MTRDARSERYAMVDEILADFDRIEGLDALWARPRHGIDDNPLAAIKFKAGAEEPLPATPISEGEVEGEDEAAREKGGGAHRPYSYQQRRGQTSMKKP